MQPTPKLDDLNREQLVAVLADALARLISTSIAPSTTTDSHRADEPERLLTVSEVGEILGFARGYTYELVRKGEIRALHHGKHWRITPAAVEEFIAKNEGSRTVDKSVSLMLSRLHDRRTTQASTKGSRARTDRARETPGRPSDDNIEVGTRVLANP